GVTVIVKAGSDALAVPSFTVITMPEKLPTLVAAGAPPSFPVVVLNVAQLGMFVIENVKVAPALGLVAVGVNEYELPTMPVVAGVPLIVGGAVDAVTVIVKLGSDALCVPSLTVITMPE